MMRFPAAILVTGMEAFTRAAREVQQMIEQGFAVPVQGFISEGSESTPPSAGTALQSADKTHVTSTFKKEDYTMIDQDLGGDDLKYVTYSILFTKRDYEATLEQQKEFIINYATDGASFASLKMIQFAGKPFKRPPAWMSKDTLYPPDVPRDQTEIEIKNIPSDDQRYLTFIYNVERRLPRQGKEYDREKIQALRGIKEELGEISEKIG
jgi:hypothetical protein